MSHWVTCQVSTHFSARTVGRDRFRYQDPWLEAREGRDKLAGPLGICT
jgi:hypothetical protein